MSKRRGKHPQVVLGLMVAMCAAVAVTSVPAEHTFNLVNQAEGERNEAALPGRVTQDHVGECPSSSRPVSVFQTLEAIRLANQQLDGGDDFRIPLELRCLLTTLKHQLRDLILDTINSHGGESPQSMQADLLRTLSNEGISVGEPKALTEWDYPDPRSIGYGYITNISIERSRASPDLLAATTTLGIDCGEDSSLYIFTDKGPAYELVMAVEARDYEEISGAQNDFSYAISPPDSDGHFFVATANVSAWCQSNWQSIRYDVLRVAPEADRPKRILSKSASIYIGVAPPVYRLRATARGFTLKFSAEQSLDFGIQMREHIIKYSVDGERATRIAPLGLRPEDFLDEWIRLPWEEASKWVDTTDLASIEDWHSRLQKIGTDGRYAELELGKAYLGCGPCEVELLAETQGDPDSLPPRMLFTISGENHSYAVREIRSSDTEGAQQSWSKH